MDLSKYATPKNRWYALVIIALGLAIVIIDNTVLNVSVPYILRDLGIGFGTLQWAISGYSLTIAAVLITVGRLGEIYGYKRMFLIGILIFVIGSFTASESHSAFTFILGRALIQAVGAAITLTSALSLLATTFKGHERAVAFGIWGSVAGASAAIGPLLGGYLTTYFSWRWSLRINIIVGLLALIGSVLIMESRRQEETCFDWKGTILSALSLFTLVFGFIQGRALGWWHASATLSWWPLSLSPIPFIFLLGLILFYAFYRHERRYEERSCPLVRFSIFRHRGFSMGLGILVLLALGQFGTFLVLPIFLENVLGLNALQVGLALLSISVSLFVFGSISGFLARRINVKWIAFTGITILGVGSALLISSLSITTTVASLIPALIVFGVGFGLGFSQLNNIIISSAPDEMTGEASALSMTVRQVGFAIGIALVGALLAGSLAANVQRNVAADSSIPSAQKQGVISSLGSVNIEGGDIFGGLDINQSIMPAVKHDVRSALVSASRTAIAVNVVVAFLAALVAFFLPRLRQDRSSR